MKTSVVELKERGHKKGNLKIALPRQRRPQLQFFEQPDKILRHPGIKGYWLAGEGVSEGCVREDRCGSIDGCEGVGWEAVLVVLY